MKRLLLPALLALALAGCGGATAHTAPTVTVTKAAAAPTLDAAQVSLASAACRRFPHVTGGMVRLEQLQDSGKLYSVTFFSNAGATEASTLGTLGIPRQAQPLASDVQTTAQALSAIASKARAWTHGYFVITAERHSFDLARQAVLKDCARL